MMYKNCNLEKAVVVNILEFCYKTNIRNNENSKLVVIEDNKEMIQKHKT